MLRPTHRPEGRCGRVRRNESTTEHKTVHGNERRQLPELRSAPFQCAILLLSSCLSSTALAVDAPVSPPSSSSSAEFALGPDNNQALLLKMIKSAKTHLKVNAYDFSHSTISDALIRAIQKGVTLELLLETQPFKNPYRAMSKDAKKVTVQIFEAMKTSRNKHHRIYLMGSNLYPHTSRSGESGTEAPGSEKNEVKRRFNFNHAKYVIADDASLLVSSENFTETGHPNPGTRGNRGWDIVVTDVPTVKKFAEIFAADRSTERKDVVEVGIQDKLPSFMTRTPTTLEWAETTYGQNSRSDLSVPTEALAASDDLNRQSLTPIGSGQVKSVQVITSPHALPALNTLLDSASESLDVEFMSLPVKWYAGRNPYLSPLVERMVELARAGVQVRVLLNDDRVFSDPGSDQNTANELTVDYLNEVARCHGLNVGAKVVDTAAVEITYIHNKGMIVDGKRVLISSINGTRNSVSSNRETAITVNGRAAGNYYGKAFSNDWEKSRMQVLTKVFTTCPELPGKQSTLAFSSPWSSAF